jgi:2,3-dihydroxyphenylpropionate 1,2-dioxygenase
MREFPNYTGIVGAAAVPHAPQMLSLPESEDRGQVERVKAIMRQIGEKFRAAEPDLIIVISNDHADQFVLKSIPPFVVHCAHRARGRDDHAGWWNLDGNAGYALIDLLQEENFDPAFTLDADVATCFTIPIDFCGYPRETAFLPLFVNAYVPPQPTPERCYLFGQALARAIQRMGRRAVIIASGALSHYPGTAVYADPGPDLATDKLIYERCAAGNLRFMLSLDAAELDRSGNIELRSWLILAGALGERRPDIMTFEPNWHHNYGVFGWTDLKPLPRHGLYYEATPSSCVELARALFALRGDSQAREAFARDPQAYADRFNLTAEQRDALLALDLTRLRDHFHIHPFIVGGALAKLAQIRSDTGARQSR